MIQEYLPFFRKYRPQSFKDIVGQESLVKTLTGAIELNRISHAYLFCGPRGTGKTSTARIFAKSLNCEHGPTIEPCQTCSSCVEITNGNGMDVIEIDAATNRGIEDAKNLIEQTQYAPIKGKYKIFIIDEVHMLSKEAFNALLKTIEEPPKNVIFILATTEPHKVLETIVSRCQRFDLRRITTKDIVKKLREVSDLEKIKITDDALFMIANNVSGGLRDSLALLDQVSILGLKEEITKETIENIIGKITFNTLFEILSAIYDKDLNRTMDLINNVYSNGAEPRNFTENFIEFLRNVIIVLNTKNTSKLDYVNLNENETEKLKSLNYDKNTIVKYIEKTTELYKDIRYSKNPYLMLEILLVELCGIDALSNNGGAVKSEPMKKEDIKKPEIKKTEETAVKKQETTEEKETEIKAVNEPIIHEEEKQKEPRARDDIKPQVTVSPTASDKQELWDTIINSISSMPAKCFFANLARLVEINEKYVKIGFLHQTGIKQAESALKINPLKAALSAHFDHEVEVRYIFLAQDSNEYIKGNLQRGQYAPKPKKTFEPKMQTAPAFEENNVNTENEEDEKEKKSNDSYSFLTGKTKEIVESFNGKVID